MLLTEPEENKSNTFASRTVILGQAMRYYCTLFDSVYLSRGLAMYRSLAKHSKDFRLYIFAFDDFTLTTLRGMALPHVEVVSLAEFETPELLAVKQTRGKGEYCWTCTPWIILHCIERFGHEACTYIDADLWFVDDPEVLHTEMGNRSVLITEHRYAPQYDKAKRKGIYCVQFITFRHNLDGMTALRWWAARCLEWCFDRVEDGKFGDQKYLDDWTDRFSGVHVLQHLGGGVAPWNAFQYTFRVNDVNVLMSTSVGEYKLIFYHFHYVKFYKHNAIDLGPYPLTESLIEYVYKPYISDLITSERILMERAGMARVIQKYFYRSSLLTVAHRLYRKLNGVYNVFDLSKLKDGVLA